MALSTYAGNAVLNALFNNTSLSLTPYASLHSSDPGLIGSNELTGNAYARVAATISAPISGVTSNTVAVDFPTATPSGWSAVTYGGLWDQLASGGNFIAGFTLDNSRTVAAGEYAEYAAEALSISLSTAFGDTTIENIINALFRATSLAITNVYASLHSSDPGGSGSNELTGNGYTRTGPLSFGVANAKACANDTIANFPAATSSNWSQATYLGLWSADTSGTFLWGKQLTTPRTVSVGKVMRIAVGGINITIT
jgi:hypothetical protein